MANAAEWLEIAQLSQWGAYRKPTSLFPTVRSVTSTTSPSLKMWVPNVPFMICRTSNGHISATCDPIHFMFGSRVAFLGSADRMALFPVRSNSTGLNLSWYWANYWVGQLHRLRWKNRSDGFVAEWTRKPCCRRETARCRCNFPRWQPATILENYSGITRFPCDSTAFWFTELQSHLIYFSTLVCAIDPSNN